MHKGMIRRVCVVAFIAFGVSLALIASAKSHQADKGWEYPWACCHDHDCAEISETRVKVGPAGYVIDGHFNVPYSEVRQSPDGRYHACFPKPDELKCFFAPPNGS